MQTNGFQDFLVYHRRFFGGVIDFPADEQGQILSLTDGSVFRQFLHVCRKDVHPMEKSVRLYIRFSTEHLTVFERSAVPLLSTPFYAGRGGFVSKRFYIDESQRTFMGIYDWENETAVREYLASYAADFMRRFSVPGSLRHATAGSSSAAAPCSSLFANLDWRSL